MTLTAVTEPVPFVTLAEVKDYLRVDGDQSDPELTAHIATACGELGGLRSIINRAIVQQTFRLELSDLPWCVSLPRPPLISVTSVTVTDQDDAEQTPAFAVYGVGNEFREAMIMPPVDAVWPTPKQAPGSVVIVYEAGIPAVDGDALAGIPQQMKTAAFVRVAQLFDRDDRAAAILESHRRSLIDALTAYSGGLA